jgi:hypothetical protein
MKTTSEESQRKQLEEARELQRSVRHYAQNRTLPVMIALAVFALLSLAIGVPSYWGGVAYRGGDATLFALCLVVVILAVTATIVLSVPRWGGQYLQRIAESVYAKEGNVTVSSSRPHRSWLIAAIGVGFGLCIVLSVILGVLGYLPTGKYMQPLSALYVVPFLVGLNYLMRPATGYIPLLWPLLYAVHAVLIIAGAPIAFEGRWEALNMFLPIVGYGLLTALVGYLYSRWALRKARAIVSRQLDRAELDDN